MFLCFSENPFSEDTGFLAAKSLLIATEKGLVSNVRMKMLVGEI